MQLNNKFFILITFIICQQSETENTSEGLIFPEENSKIESTSNSTKNSNKYVFLDIVDQLKKKKQEEVEEDSYDMDEIFKKCTNYKKRDYVKDEDSSSYE
ncbi:hypothetical protein NAPIS_ORF01387 [Vairimorpha apis BRL 01]|uniref:Fam-c protein n=1 Tax=Vairimorpha apis BRL 01 TaxID=1037528 RepID=T0MJD4_9MICR|nr:hypothetical protein NAPIS_ORF01387 [Vairimorpha apis BRL 01]